MSSETRNDPARERFAALVIAGTPLAEAADELGISVRTAQRWRHDPQVAEALAEYRRATRSAVTDRLAAFVDTALSRAEELLSNPDTPPGVIARLLGLALSEARLWAEHGDILERLERLEVQHLEADPLAEAVARYG